MPPILHIHLLREFRLMLDNDLVLSVDKPRSQDLLAYLLLHRHVPQLRQQIAFQFWPDSSESQARTNLRKLFHQLRQDLPQADQFIASDWQHLSWRSEADYVLDVAEVESLCDRLVAEEIPAVETVERLLSLYQGELLPHCYDDWILPLRQALHERVVNSLAVAAEGLEQHRAYETAIRCAEHLLRLDPLHEATYRQLMQLRALGGDRTGALRAYHQCAAQLERELAVAPSVQTRAVYERLLSQEDQPVASGPAAPAAEQLPLIGRQSEWNQLQAAWRAADTQPRLAMIWGEAGTGKTRLVEELMRWARPRAGTVAYARSYAAEGALSYAPVKDWLRAQSVRTALNALDDVWLVELVRLLPELLVAHSHLSAPSPLREGWQQQRFHEALARAVLAAERPLLLVLDDVQWCDEETLAWLHYLLRVDMQAPLLVVATARIEEVDEAHPLHNLLRQLHRERRCSELTLAPLNAEETASLVEQMVGEKPMTWIEHLFQESEGNPLFVVESVRARQIDGQVAQTSRSNGSLSGSLPPTVQSVIAARLAQLTPAAYRLAQFAATIGRAFTFDVLATASGLDEDALMQNLDELWQRRIVREKESGYDFSHDKIRETAYAELSQARRRQVHGKVAKALERVFAHDLDEVCGQLAVHYEQAQQWERAAMYWQQTARRAAAQFAHGEAVHAITCALNLIPVHEPLTRYRLLLARAHIYHQQNQLDLLQSDVNALAQIVENGPENHGCQAELGVLRAQMLMRLGRYPDAIAVAETSAAQARMAGVPHLEAESLFCAGRALWYMGALDSARDRLKQALASARQAEHTYIAGRALEMLSSTGYFSGMSMAELVDYLEQSMLVYRESGNLSGQASVHSKLGYVLVDQGEDAYSHDAEAHYRRSIDLARQVGDRDWEGISLSDLGALYTYRGQYTQAATYLSQARACAHNGHVVREAVALDYIGFDALNQGAVDQALLYLQESLELLEERVSLQWQAKALSDLALAHYCRGEHLLARSYAQRAVAVTAQLHDWRQEAQAQTRLGHVYLDLGLPDDAADCYRRALHLHRTLQQPNHSMQPLAGLAKVAWRGGAQKEAIAHVAQILDHLRHHQLDRTEESLWVYLTCFQVLQGRDKRRAHDVLVLAQTQLQTRAGAIAEADRQRLFWAMPAHEQIREATANKLVV